MVDGMELEDGCLWIHGTAYEETIAFTNRELESLREMPADHKRSQPSLRS